jgi:hypothetical protein
MGLFLLVGQRSNHATKDGILINRTGKTVLACTPINSMAANKRIIIGEHSQTALTVSGEQQ